jgi:hypothetical protein
LCDFAGRGWSKSKPYGTWDFKSDSDSAPIERAHANSNDETHRYSCANEYTGSDRYPWTDSYACAGWIGLDVLYQPDW